MKDEVRTSLHRLVQNIGKMAERKPEAPVDAEDFNQLLARAKKAYPESSTVQEMASMKGGANAATLLVKVSILQGAVDEDFERRRDAVGW